MGFKDTIMGFAGKVSDTVDKGIEAGKDGYQKISEKNRINKEMKQLDTEITDIFTAVGKEIFMNNPECEDFLVVFDSVREKKAKLSNLKKQLNLLDGLLLCDSCGSAVPSDSKVCNQCGAEIIRPEFTIEPEIKEVVEACICPKCGEKLPSDANFCGKCGASLEDKE